MSELVNPVSAAQLKPRNQEPTHLGGASYDDIGGTQMNAEPNTAKVDAEKSVKTDTTIPKSVPAEKSHLKAAASNIAEEDDDVKVKFNEEDDDKKLDEADDLDKALDEAMDDKPIDVKEEDDKDDMKEEADDDKEKMSEEADDDKKMDEEADDDKKDMSEEAEIGRAHV